MFMLVPLCPLVSWAKWEAGPGELCAYAGWCHSQGILRLETPSLIKRLLANLLDLCLGGDIVFIVLESKQIRPLPKGDTVLACQGCLLNKHPWKDSPEQKVSQDSRNSRGLWRTVSDTA